MGGEIGVESELGEGSTFLVTLPLPKVGEALAPPFAAAAGAAAAPEAGLPQVRVLAAEDNAVNQLVLKTLLHQIGVEPLVVENGAGGGARPGRTRAWDVILMDMQMPVMDGLTATRAIRQREADMGRARTPIIALTANAMSHQVAAVPAPPAWTATSPSRSRRPACSRRWKRRWRGRGRRPLAAQA